jgi:hypothetical protein
MALEHSNPTQKNDDLEIKSEDGQNTGAPIAPPAQPSPKRAYQEGERPSDWDPPTP